jgi:hypothetical protein
VACWFVSDGSSVRFALSTLRRPSRVLSKLAYLAVCRSMQALVLLARGDAAKDLEILMLRHLKGTETRMRPVTCWFVWGDSSVR